MDPQQALLAQVQRSGWQVIARRPETKKQQVQSTTESGKAIPGAYHEEDVLTGNYVWSIAPAEGQPGQAEDMVVKVVGDGRSGGYEVVPGGEPKRVLAKPTTDTTSPGETTYQDDPANPGQQIGGRIVNGVFQPITGLNGQPLARAKPADKASGPETQIVGGDLYERDPTAPGGWKKVISKPGDPVTREVGGALHQYDPATGKWSVAVAAPPAKPEPPRVTTPTNVQWEDIPESDQQQGYEIVNGQKRLLEGVTKRKDEPATTMVGGVDDEKWTFLDKQGNVVRTTTNPGYKAKPPTYSTVTTGDQPFITSRRSDTGELVHEPTPGYVPKTGVEIAAQLGRVQSTAQAKRDELKAKIGAGYTAEQATNDFNTWWDQNVEPQRGALQAAAEEASYARGKELAAQRVAAQNAATSVGNQAVSAYEASKGRRVGMNANEVMKQAATGSLQGIDWQGSALYKGRDPEEIAREATANALKHLLPQGDQPPAWMATSPSDALNRSNYQSAFASSPAAAAATVGGGGPAPTPVMTDQPRADQISGATPYGNALAPNAGATGTVNPGDLNFLGTFADQFPPVADYVAPEEFVPEPWAGPPAMPVGEYPLRRRVRPAPTQVNLDPFAQQALAAGLGQGGLAPSRWVPPQYEYPGGPVPY